MRTIEERFWSKVTIGEPDACWPWTASLGPRGYGQFRHRKTMVTSSRIAWALMYGDPGMFFVLHRCDNRPCCNPAHLFLGTHDDNMADMAAKGRRRGGRGPGRTPAPEEVARFVEVVRRLTDKDIAEARFAHGQGESCRSIARRLGVANTTISRLVNGTHWRTS